MQSSPPPSPYRETRQFRDDLFRRHVVCPDATLNETLVAAVWVFTPGAVSALQSGVMKLPNNWLQVPTSEE